MSVPHKKHWFGLGLLAAALMIELPFLYEEFHLAFSNRAFDPDMFTLYGFYRYFDASLFPNDYTADYYLSLWMPPGFKALQYAWAQFFDPAILHRLLPVALWLSCIPAVYISARRLGGNLNAFATAALYMGSSMFIFRLTGGMAHGFGFPLIWWTVAALLSGSPASLALATLASAAFYPIIMPVAGLTLAFWLFFPSLAPTVSRPQWPWQRKFGFLSFIAVTAACIFLPLLLTHSGTGYGRALTSADANTFPELRNATGSINPFLYVLVTYVLQNSSRLGIDSGQILTLAIFGVLMVSILFHDVRDRRPGNLKPFLCAAGLCFLLSFLFSYNNAYRFAIYTVPVLITLYLPLALQNLCRGLLPSRFKNVAFAALMLGYMACIGKADPAASGYLFEMQDFQANALTFIETLPKDALIAGWPGDRFGRIVEAVPYVAKRQALVTWAGHPITHSDYVLTMRERMNAIVDAYLARDVAPLLYLRDHFHVDYLVVNEVDFAGTEPPHYIEPFSSRAQALWDNNPQRHFIVLNLAQSTSVYSHDGITILDLHRL